MNIIPTVSFLARTVQLIASWMAADTAAGPSMHIIIKDVLRRETYIVQYEFSSQNKQTVCTRP